eukprot:m.197846 g.197846  ORF g.197846 m.197846 type:complete len:213 (+) comp15712_c0_seq1:133-771(+)
MINPCTAILIWLRVFRRRILSLFGFGVKAAKEEPLLPTHSTTTKNPNLDEHGLARVVPSDEQAWDEWTNEARTDLSTPQITREKRREKKIDDIFSQMEPEVKAVKPKKMSKKLPRYEGARGSANVPYKPRQYQESTSKFEVDATFSVTDELGTLDDEDEAEDAWDGDDVDEKELKEIEKMAKRKARMERNKELQAKKKDKKNQPKQLGHKAS